MPRKAPNSLDIYPEPEETLPPDIAQVALTPLEVATFIENMAAELRVMARNVDFDMLAYLLDMTRIEASAQIEQIARDREG